MLKKLLGAAAMAESAMLCAAHLLPHLQWWMWTDELARTEAARTRTDGEGPASSTAERESCSMEQDRHASRAACADADASARAMRAESWPRPRMAYADRQHPVWQHFNGKQRHTAAQWPKLGRNPQQAGPNRNGDGADAVCAVGHDGGA